VTDNSQLPALGPGERQELEQLRAEVARLRLAQENARPVAAPVGGDGYTRRGRAWGRTTGAVVLILLAVMLAPLSVVSVWARAVVSDTDRYVETVAPLADDPAVQKAIASNITNRVFTYIDVKGLTTQAFDALAEKGTLPPALSAQLQALAVPLANGVRSFAEGQVLNAVQSDVFASAWSQANQVAHQQLIAALTGKSGSAVLVENDAVKVDMAAFLGVVKQRLISSGFQLAERIPVVRTEFTIFQSADVGKVRQGFSILNTLGLGLPFLLLLMAGLGIYLAADHRRAFGWTGIGLALAMFLTGAALTLARQIYLDGVPAAVLPRDAAAALYDTLIRFLRDAIRSAGLVGLFAAAGAFLSGPSVTAVTLRGWINAALAAAKGAVASLGLDLSPVTRWVAPRAAALRAMVLVAAFLVVLLERYRTPELVINVAIGVVVALTIVQFLAITPRATRRQPGEPGEAGEPAAGTAVPPPAVPAI
jgi:hypothetical protein